MFITEKVGQMATPQAPKLQAPGAIKIAATIGFIETLMIVSYAVLMVLSAASNGGSVGMAVALAAFFVLIAATIAFSGYRLLQGKPSGRSMLLIWQLFIVILGVQAMLGNQFFVGLCGTVLAGINIILLFASSVNAYLET